MLLTIGDEKDSKKKLINLGGRVHSCFPIGSHKMESMWYRKKRQIKIRMNQRYFDDRFKSLAHFIATNPLEKIIYISQMDEKYFHKKLKTKHNLQTYPNFHQYSSEEEDEILKIQT